jgi:glucan 1,3-beta-glucosidase
MRPEQWNATVIEAMKNIYLSGVDALQSNFFWTWKIGSTSRYANPAPNWSYKLGLQMGWIPDDPREADGFCQREANKTAQVTFTGYQPFMTGGVGAGQIPASASIEYPWPLTSMAPSFGAADMESLYQYTRTAPPLAPPSLAPSYTGLPDSVSSQLAPTITRPAQAAFTPVEGCTYPDVYSAFNMSLPATSACGAGAPASEAYYKRAVITPAPRV